MYAVLRVDLQTRIFARFVPDNFIHAGRAIALFRCVVNGEVGFYRHHRIADLQMTGLLFFVIGVGQKHRTQAIEGQHTIRLRIIDLRALCGGQQFQMIGLIGQRPRCFATKNHLIDTEHQ